MANAEEWAQAVQGLAQKLEVRYEPVGGLNPRWRACGAVSGRHEPADGAARP